MSKYYHFLLVIAYIFITMATIFIILTFFGWNIVPRGGATRLFITACWMAFCFSAVYWWPQIVLMKMNVRRGILEEENRILSCMQALQSKLDDISTYQLLIFEDPGPNAFAIGKRTIVLSDGILNLLDESEISAVLAHELGHLRSNDCMVGTAFSVAFLIPSKIQWLTGICLQSLGRGFRARSFYGGGIPLQEYIRVTISLIAVGMLFAYFHLFHYLLAIISLDLLLKNLDKLFLSLWLWNSRLREYKQDAFAHELGFGLALKQALLKITKSIPAQPVNLYTVLMYHNHPVVYNRIRRLEKLAGLR